MSSLDGKETIQLTDEDKAWLKQRKKNTNQAASIGGGLGFMTLLALLNLRPKEFPLPVYQRGFLLASGIVIGGLGGFLYGDRQSLSQIEKSLGEGSEIRKQWQQLAWEASLSKKDVQQIDASSLRQSK